MGQHFDPHQGFTDIQEHMLPEGVTQQEMLRSHAGVEGFFERPEGLALDELDPDLGAFTEFQGQEPAGHFDRVLRGSAPVPAYVRDQHLQHLFKNFIHSSRTQQKMAPMENLGLNLSGLEKEKIRNRMGIMAHHFTPGPTHESFVQAQLENLFESLDISGRAGPREDWQQEFMEKERFARGKERMGEVEQWVDDFHDPRQAQARQWEAEFREMNHHMASRPWEQEYENFNEAEFRQFNGAWQEIQGERWVDDFERANNSLENKIAYIRSLDNLTDEQAAAELQSLGRRISAISEPHIRNSKFVQLMDLLGNGSLVVDGNQLVEPTTSTSTSASGAVASSTTTSTSASTTDSPGVDLLNEWLTEFEDFEAPPLRGWDFRDFENDEELQQMFGSASSSASASGVDALFGEGGIWGYLRPYEFEDVNKYRDHPQPFLRGKELFDQGELGDAILAFEAAAQRDINNPQIWRSLGQAHAENDRDDRAIAALLRAVRIDNGDLDALMALSVSCTNDSYKDQAMLILRTWLQQNPRYKDHVPQWMGAHPHPHPHPLSQDENLQDSVTEMFLEAARLSPHDPDPDVQIALGLLFNISGDYDKAVDCFRTALQKRPDDYLLWNKLGATLANSNHSKEALAPYYKSLQIKPTYTRARANLGISYLNLEMYQEAAVQFMSCLAIQPAAKHIWMSLQTVFSRMERDDLLEKTLQYDIDLFRDEFTF